MPLTVPIMEEELRTALFGGIVVCGGESRRMGSDKAHLALGGRSFLERASALLGERCGQVVLACGPVERYGDAGLPLVLDEVPDGGPLAGIAAGLAALDTDYAVVLPLDMPRVSPAVISELQQRVRADGLDVLFLASERGIEPLCAVYGRAALPAMRRALLAGDRKVTSFLRPEHLGDGLRVGELPLTELSQRGVAPDCLENVNTPQDLARVRDRQEDAR